MRVGHSDAFRDFVTQLLEKDSTLRLGTQGEGQVTTHAWFKEHEYLGETVAAFDFEALEAKQLPVPYCCFERNFSISNSDD